MTDAAQQRLPISGEVLAPTHATSILPGKMRVLHVQAGDSDCVLLIAVEPIRSHGRIYFHGPVALKLSVIQKDLATHRARILTEVTQRPDAVAADDDLDRKYKRRGQEKSRTRQKREERWAILKPLVGTYDDRILILDRQIRHEKIAARATEIATDRRSLARTKRLIADLLNQYWAGGSTKGALTPFADAHGARGRERIQHRKLGRRNTPTKTGRGGHAGFVMTEEDKDQCGFAWRNYYIRGKTIAKALRRMWREFYSEVSTNARGQAVHTLFPQDQRPTRVQFERWGRQRSPGHEAWKTQLTKFSLARLNRALLGSNNENIVAIGQLGGMDSTAPDIQFVSVLNRLKRIGGAHRILIIDAKYGYIPGFYLGLDAPSAKTVRLAMLHALADKKDWLSWLGLSDQDPNNWLRIQFARLVADNTDLRCVEVEQCLESIACGVQFVPVARSDLNSGVESAHHILHRSADHNLHGTTHGRRKERGERSPDEHARHTILEAIRETARAIYAHNTMELDVIPTLAAHRELVARGIKLTRTNLTRWDMERGKVATSLIGADEARMKLLMPIRGTFTKRGIKLLRSDRGHKREFIEPVRYVSTDRAFVEQTIRAKVMRGRASSTDWDDDFLHNPYEPNHIYYRDPISGQLTQLDARVPTDDSERLEECSLPDMVELMDSCADDRFNARVTRDESLSDLEDAQDRTNEESEVAYQRDLEAAPKKPSKAALKRDKKPNREAEKAVSMYGMPVMPSTEAPTIAASVTKKEATSTVGKDQDPLTSPPVESRSPVAKPPSTPPSPATSSSPLVQSILKRIAERSRHA